MILERILAQHLGLLSPSEAATGCPPDVEELACPHPLVSLWIEAAGVLYDDTHWWRWLAQLISHVGRHVSHDQLQQSWECEFLRDAGAGRADVWLALRRCLIRHGLPTARCDEVQAAAVARQKVLQNPSYPLPGARTALAQLTQSGISLMALASVDCSPGVLAQRLSSLALAAPFERFVGTSEGEFPPTNPGFYLDLAASQGLPPCETALASNKPQHLAAARAAGFSAIAIGCSPEVEADLHLDLLAALPRKLSSCCARSLAA